MRIRSIKPDFWTSEDIAALDWQTRLLFIGLWSYVDDNGVGRDIDKLIKADLFPLEDDPRDTLATVSRGLQKLSEGGQITRYAVAGKPYLYVNAWEKHQRIDKPNKVRYPPPTCEDASIRDILATSSRDSSETPAPGAGEQRSRGTEEQGNSVDSLALVEATRDDVERICNHLATRIEENGSKRPTITAKWRDSARLMLDRDERTEVEVIQAIDWCQADDFWRGNVMSLPKLREKFDQMRLQAQRSTPKRKGDIDWDAALAQARAIGGDR